MEATAVFRCVGQRISALVKAWQTCKYGFEQNVLPPGDAVRRMLFGNEDVFKQVHVLSGGEKVRCMLSKMMLSGANVVLLDQPTNHLDMESIQAVNKGLEAFSGVVLLASHDHEMLESTCNRVIAFQPDGTIVDRYGTYDEYLYWMDQKKQKENQ